MAHKNYRFISKKKIIVFT